MKKTSMCLLGIVTWAIACFAQAEGVSLPDSAASLPLPDGPELIVSKEAVFLGGTRVADWKEAGPTGGSLMVKDLYEALKEERERLELSARENDRPDMGRILIRADRGISFGLLTRVLYSAGQAEFREFRLITSQGGDRPGLANIIVMKPRQGEAISASRKPPLNLTLGIVHMGIYISGAGGVLSAPDGSDSTPSIPLVTEKEICLKHFDSNTLPPARCYDFSGLHEKLIEIKKVFPDERSIIIHASSDVPYEIVVGVLDAAREYPEGELFPEVAFSAGTSMRYPGFDSGVSGEPANPISGAKVQAGAPSALEFDSNGRKQKDVIKYISRRLGGYKHCYEKGLKKNPTLEGKVEIQFVIRPDGGINEVRVVKNTTGDRELASCVAARTKSFRFRPSDGGESTVAYPLIFTRAR